ncbi:MAG: phenylalanine--tRNA ligase subunit alpha [Thermoproteota archaeon]|nr:MAG: phenylalanine--tRNA ligase subunit alpha [Candidatus Korarchaeota archaeon]
MRSISLSEGEIRLLELLAPKEGVVKINEISMEKSSAIALAHLLAQKGILEVIKRPEIVVKLTERGIRCVTLGLPEERLVKALEKRGGKIPLKELFKTGLFESNMEINVAIGEARKLGLIELRKSDGETLVNLIKPPEKLPLKEVLTRVHRSKVRVDEVDPKTLSLLKKRGLVKEEKHVELGVKLTDLGRRILAGEVKIKREISALTKELIESGMWKEATLKRYDIKAKPPKVYPGKLQMYAEFLDEVREILIGLGFEEVKGPFVEAEFWNFDALFQPQDHPAREIHSSYILEYPKEANLRDLELVERVRRVHEDGWITGSTGWGYKWSFDIARRLVLRTQTTAVSARTIASRKELPLKIFSIDHVFRPDVLDRTHSMDFHQCEGVVMDRGLNVKHLLGFLATLAMELGFKRDEIRFKPDYFPFTEPSVETLVKHERLGWIEVLGAGLFRPEVLAPLGIDSKEVGALAWGIGIGRLAMARLGIEDIRDLHSRDLTFLREFGGR